MRKVLTFLVLGLVITGVVGFAGFKLFQVQIGVRMADRMVSARMQTDLLTELGEGLHVGICGSGSPLPDPTRAGPCLTVIAGDRVFVVDSGGGSTSNLLTMGVPMGEIEAVLLTHFHSDHIGDLGDLMMQRWVGAANTEPVTVYGPEGVARVVAGFNDAYRLDSSYRTAHHGVGIAPPLGAGGRAVTVPLGEAPDADTVVLDDEGLRITMFRVDHDPVHPAVGYRFDYAGRSVVISGDTAYSESVVEHAAGADLLLHEALQPVLVNLIRNNAAEAGNTNLAQIAEDILDYHTTPEDAARVAQQAGVDALVLYHIVPPAPNRALYAAFLGDARDYYDGPLTVGEDGMWFSLPAGETDEIIRQRR